MDRRIRDERGEIALAGWLVALVVVGVVAAVPFALMMRQETKTADAAIDAAGRAMDAGAELMLTNAIRGAQVWFAEQGTLQGYGPVQATGFDPQTTYDAAAVARSGRVSIRGVGAETAVFVTAGGQGPLCVALTGDVVSYGRLDAATAAECGGGSWD